MATQTRRTILLGAGALAVLGGAGAVTHSTARSAHARAADDTWISDEQARERYPDVALRLVHYATLAANSHNTQPWLFQIAPNRITIRPDFSRRTDVVDPEDRHLFASLGCAAENIVVAAEAAGQDTYVESNLEGVIVHFVLGRSSPSPHFGALLQRQCVRFDYSGEPASTETLRALQATADQLDVDLALFTDDHDKQQLSNLILAANTAQIGDPAFVAELKDWIRFDGRHALATRDGLYAGSTGNPTLPRWLGQKFFDLGFTVEAENAKTASHVATSAGLAVITAWRDDPVGWIEAGRACQRFAHEATVHGLKYAFLNQPIEVPEARPNLQSFLASDRPPNLMMRFGTGPTCPRSLRRPPQAVLVS